MPVETLIQSCQVQMIQNLEVVGAFSVQKFFSEDNTQFLTKFTQFVPFFFIISQYCPTLERILPELLCFPNKLGGLALIHA
jgi:hypothetical protein